MGHVTCIVENEVHTTSQSEILKVDQLNDVNIDDRIKLH
jgi:hypothetical protein